MEEETTGLSGVQVNLDNFPASGDESGAREIVFGPLNEKMVVLIEISETFDGVDITVGNGPDTRSLAAALPNLLRDIGDLVGAATDTPEFWDAVLRTELNK